MKASSIREVRASGVLVARIAANAGGVQREGEIRREDSRFVVYMFGRAIGQAGSLGGGAHRLAEAIRRDLPRQIRDDWGVEAQCMTRDDVAVVFGNLARGIGGGAPANACVARALAEYRHDENTLERALATAARLIAECCTP